MKEQSVILKVTGRLIPYLFLCYILNYLDRFNISFAALEMKDDLHFSDAVYGAGASMLFVGYALFGLPSNLVLEKIGARRWITCMMVCWGSIAAGMMLVRTPLSFYLFRFCLGVAEAGFFPGIIYYLTYWIPARARSRAFALFLTSTSLAGVFGGPISAGLLQLKGFLGLAGWQWIFLAEGTPTILLGILTFFVLPDRPKDVSWLTAGEKLWLTRQVNREIAAKERRHRYTLWGSMALPKVWVLGFLYFMIIICYYAVAFWLPQIVKNFSGFSNSTVALVSAIPYLAASIGMVWVAHHSDRANERRWHVAVPAFTAALALILGAAFQANHPLLAFLALCVTATGIWSTLGPFWSLPNAFLSGTAAAAGIALINSMGNVGGFVGPRIIGDIKEATHHFESGLLVLAATLIVAGFIALMLKEEPVGGS